MSTLFSRTSDAVSQTDGIANGVESSQVSRLLEPLVALVEQAKQGAEVTAGTLSSIMDLVMHPDAIDDRKLLLEYAFAFITALPTGRISSAANDKIIELLYNDLPHPVATNVGNKYAWRTADGSRNNPDLPDMGKAGVPYSRSVQRKNACPVDQLPAAELVFDALLRRDEFREHPAGLSSLFFAFATLVIHCIFRTSRSDPSTNETSSYADLSPLYGHNAEVQEKVRAYDGFGHLHPDTFGEDRLLFLPPAVCSILVLFNRNHNYIAKRLFEINERGTYQDPSTLTPDKCTQQDEEIFQTARLINCGWFIYVILGDYLSVILGLIRKGNTWSLNPFDEIRKDDHSLFERGKGNVVSCEFNCLYRWHSTTSVSDENWTKQVFRFALGDVDIDTLTPRDLVKAAEKLVSTNQDPTKWTFGGFERQADGRFRDEDLANALQNATAEPAAAFGARGVPAIMRTIEVMGIEQSRIWGVCSLNEFRKFFGLKTFSTFLEWNSNPEIADAAEKLYGDIDDLELYVGLQAEDTKPVVEGAGLCPGYTASRAILSDAIALTRGDRFCTHDFTPYNYTAWGFKDCQRNPRGFGFGSQFARLLLRTLPRDYSDDSVYTYFAFMTPDAMQKNLDKLGVLKQYNLQRPQHQMQQIHHFTHNRDIVQILENPADFGTPYPERASRILATTDGFYPVQDEQTLKGVINALNGSSGLLESIGHYFYDITQQLIAENSFTLVGSSGSSVDLIKNVIRLVPVYWAAFDLAGIQLKTKKNPGGIYTPQELYQILTEIHSFIFLDIEPSKIRETQSRVEKATHDLLYHIKTHLGVGNPFSITGFLSLLASLFNKNERDTEHHENVTNLSEISHSTDELANSVLAVMVISMNLSLITTNTINVLLDTDLDVNLKNLAKSAYSSELDPYITESLRVDPPLRGFYRTSTKNQNIGGHTLKRGDRIFVDIGDANQDEKVFTRPATFDHTRSSSSVVYGDGAIKYLGKPLVLRIVSEVLRAVYAYNNIRRAPGNSGKLKRFTNSVHRQYRYAYLDSENNISPWPGSLFVQYDA